MESSASFPLHRDITAFNGCFKFKKPHRLLAAPSSYDAFHSVDRSGFTDMESTTEETTMLTVKRTTTFLASLLVALCCGTNYVRNFISYLVSDTRVPEALKLPRFILVGFIDKTT